MKIASRDRLMNPISDASRGASSKSGHADTPARSGFFSLRELRHQKPHDKLVFVIGNQGHYLVHIDVHVVMHDAVAQTYDGIPRWQVVLRNHPECCLSQ